MDVIDERRARPQPGLDLDRFRLRTVIESPMGTDELQVHDERIDLAGVAEVFESEAALLRQPGPEGAGRHPLASTTAAEPQ